MGIEEIYSEVEMIYCSSEKSVQNILMLINSGKIKIASLPSVSSVRHFPCSALPSCQ